MYAHIQYICIVYVRVNNKQASRQKLSALLGNYDRPINRPTDQPSNGQTQWDIGMLHFLWHFCLTLHTRILLDKRKSCKCPFQDFPYGSQIAYKVSLILLLKKFLDAEHPCEQPFLHLYMSVHPSIQPTLLSTLGPTYMGRIVQVFFTLALFSRDTTRKIIIIYSNCINGSHVKFFVALS